VATRAFQSPAEVLRQKLAGAGVWRKKGACELANELLPLPLRHTTIVPTAADRVDGLVDSGFMLPDQCTGSGIESVDVVVAGRDIHDAVPDDRRSFHRIFQAKTRAKMHHPSAF